MKSIRHRPIPSSGCQEEANSSESAKSRKQPALLALALLIGFTIAWAFDGAIGLARGNTVQTVKRGGGLHLSLSQFATDLDRPVGIVGSPDGRLFVLEQDGVIRVTLSNGTVLPTPFLDIQLRVDSSASEMGLLGMALHPQYTSNGYFYLNYTHTAGGTRRTRISRFQVTANPDVADPNSEQILLTINQPYANHNAGHILFGPDGYLYIPLGDGGGGGDTSNNAQNLSLLLGKISRIDVDSGPGQSPDCFGIGAAAYSIPSSNPLVDGPGGTCDEIWAVGLRNPWRSSFDRLTGDLFLGDVGQGNWEEVDFQPASSAGAENYGWRCYEGNAPYNTTGCSPPSAYTFPIFVYDGSGTCAAIVGGYIYRGAQYPAMVGHYLLTDYCSGTFWDLIPNGQGGWISQQHTNLARFGYAAFGEDAAGELYVANVQNGTVYRVHEDTPRPTATPTIVFTPNSWRYLPVLENQGL